MLTPAALTIPALFLAGVQTSAHCVFMCAGFNASIVDNRRGWLLLHSGRLLTYVFWGALAGILGQALLFQVPEGALTTPIRVTLGVAVIALGLIHVRRQKHGHCVKNEDVNAAGWKPLVSGIAWGFVPCPVLYAAIFIAALTAAPLDGAVLMLAFGLGTMPAFLLQNEAIRRAWFGLSIKPQWRGYAISMCGGLIVLTAIWMPESFGVFCAS